MYDERNGARVRMKAQGWAANVDRLSNIFRWNLSSKSTGGSS